MDVKGNFAFLTNEEQAATGYEAVIDVNQLNIEELYNLIDRLSDRLLYLQSADDDELTNARRATIPREHADLEIRRSVAKQLAGALIVRGCEESLPPI